MKRFASGHKRRFVPSAYCVIQPMPEYGVHYGVFAPEVAEEALIEVTAVASAVPPNVKLPKLLALTTFARVAFPTTLEHIRSVVGHAVRRAPHKIRARKPMSAASRPVKAAGAKGSKKAPVKAAARKSSMAASKSGSVRRKAQKSVAGHLQGRRVQRSFSAKVIESGAKPITLKRQS